MSESVKRNSKAQNQLESADVASKALLPKERVIELADKTVTALVALGTIAMALSSYYNKQTILLWSAYFTVVMVLIIPCLYLQKYIWEQQKQQPSPQSLPVKTAEVQAPAFSISISTLFRGRPNSSHEGFWVADPKERKMAPVPITMYVSFVNLQPHSSMIKSYGVDMQIKSGDWIKLKSIRVFEGSNFEPVFVFADGTACKADLVTFEEVISGSNIPPHEPKFGWMFFDVPTDYQIGQKLVFRFVVRDVTGGTSEILVNAPTEEEENQLKGTMANFLVKEKLPIEGYEKGYFGKLF